MTSKDILTLYRNTISITKTSLGQKRLFDAWCSRPAPHRVLAFDTETTDVDKSGRVFGISLAFLHPVGGYPVLVWARENTALFYAALSLLNITTHKVAHNARFDIRMLADLVDVSDAECTYIMSRIYYDRRRKHSLKELAEFLCPELSQWGDPVKEELKRLRAEAKKAGLPKESVNYSHVPDAIMGKYSMLDSFICLMLYYHLWPHIKQDYMEVYTREKAVSLIINKIENVGLRFDSAKAKEHAVGLRKIAKLEKNAIQLLAGSAVNPASPIQVVTALRSFDVPDKLLTAKGKVTTASPVLVERLEQMPRKAQSFVKALLNYRAATKTVNTYLAPLAKRADADNGIIYCHINPADSRTGRMASREPNLQNIPNIIARRTGQANPVRECFTCRPGCAIYYFDYSQMEMAYFGMLAGDQDILNGYAAGEDIHLTMGRIIYGPDCTQYQRDVTKNINFGVIYGMGVRTMAQLYKMSLAEAREFLNIYYAKFPSVHRFQEQCKREIARCGYVQDLFGRRYHIAEAYKAVNALVQGGCAQVFKTALISLESFFKHESFATDEVRIVLPVHDEFQIEAPILKPFDEKILCTAVVVCMTDVPQLIKRGLQLRVGVSKTLTNWAEKEKIAV